MEAMVGIVGIIVGAICTYYFNNLNTKKSNSYDLEREYVDKVCVIILQYLEDKSNNDSLGRQEFQEIIKFVEDIYNKNYLCITEKEKEILLEMKKHINGDLNVLITNYTILKEYYNTCINDYKSKISGNNKKSMACTSLYRDCLILVIANILSVIVLISGIAGVCGIHGWSASIYDRFHCVIWDYGLYFSNSQEPFVFLGLGALWGLLGVWIYKNKIKKYIKFDM